MKVVDEVKDAYVLRVTAYTLDNKYFQEIEQYVKKKFEMDAPRAEQAEGQ